MKYRNEQLKQVKNGQCIMIVTGPGETPKPGLCADMGVVVGIEENKFGISLKVEMSDGSLEFIDSLNDQSEMGIGCYIYPELI